MFRVILATHAVLAMILGCGGPATRAVEWPAMATATITEDPVTVECVGRGDSVAAACEDGIISGLRMIVGEYIDADVVIANDRVVSESVTSFTRSGKVRSERIGEPRLVGDQIEVTMRVTTAPSPLIRQVQGDLSMTIPFDGATLAAEISIALDDREAMQELARKILDPFPFNCMRVELVDAEGKGIASPDRSMVRVDASDGQTKLVLIARISFDNQKWKTYYETTLRPFLDAVSYESRQNRLIANGRPVSGNHVGPAPPLGATRFDRTSGPLRYVEPPQDAPSDAIALLVEARSQSRESQLVYDLYWLPKFILGSRSRGSGPNIAAFTTAPTLTLNLTDTEGETVDSTTITLGGDSPRYSLSSGGPYFLAPDHSFSRYVEPFARWIEGSRFSPSFSRSLTPGFGNGIEIGALRKNGDHSLLLMGPRWMPQGSGVSFDVAKAIWRCAIPIDPAELGEVSSITAKLSPP